MNDLQPILLLLAIGAIIAAGFLWRRVAALESELRGAKGITEDKRAELEKVRAESKKRSDELEIVRKDLQDTKAKLARQKKEAHASGGKKSRNDGSVPVEVASQTSAATVVTLSNSDMEAAHSKAMGEVRAKLDKANKRIADLEAAEAKRKEAAEKAAKAIRNDGAVEADVVAARTPEERAEALEAQLEAFKRAAADREKKLSKQVKQAEERAKTATRRANGNRDSYQVIKGQLELAQDKLALLRRKYEGAKKPEQLAPPPVEAAEAVEEAAADDAVASSDAANAVDTNVEVRDAADETVEASANANVEASEGADVESKASDGASSDAATAAPATDAEGTKPEQSL